jgi:hypothetical protein
MGRVKAAFGLLIASVGAVALAGCSLLAPSDSELMGGAKDGGASGDGASEAGGDGGADDAASDVVDTDVVLGDGGCLPAGFFCNGVPSKCCSGTCNAGGGHKCD